jgi:ABC-2 type transport system permease protein
MIAAKIKRTFKTAAWLGWKIESNWADPLLFMVYSIVRPLSAAGILVVMYMIITNGDFANPAFGYLYVGNAFYQYVAAVMTGVSWGIVDDREHYRTLKYLYVAPLSITFYLLGRAVAKEVISSLAVIITMAAGMIFLQVPVDLAKVDWLLFLVSWFLGLGMLMMMGLALGGITLLMAKHSDWIGDVVASSLFLFSGAVFPLEVLPVFLRPIGFIVPISYWLELIRRSLIGKVAAAYPTFQGLTNTQLVLILLGMTLFFTVVGSLVFRACDRKARQRGVIDQATNY